MKYLGLHIANIGELENAFDAIRVKYKDAWIDFIVPVADGLSLVIAVEQAPLVSPQPEEDTPE